MSLEKRLKFLERIINKLPPLALQCDRTPSLEQIAQIDRAESLGRRVFLFMRLQATCWISGAEKPWEIEQCD
jgi:hypothetical protein